MTAPLRTFACRRALTPAAILLDDFTAPPYADAEWRQAQVGGYWRRMYGAVYSDAYDDIRYNTAPQGLTRTDFTFPWEALLINRHIVSGESWDLRVELDLTIEIGQMQLVLLANMREVVPLDGSGGGSPHWIYGRIDGVYTYLYYKPAYGTDAEVGTWQGVTHYAPTAPRLFAGINEVVLSRRGGSISVSINGVVAVSGGMSALLTGQFDDVALGLSCQPGYTFIRSVRLIHM